MENAGQTTFLKMCITFHVQKIQEDQDNNLNDARGSVLTVESNEPVKGLCVNCSNFPGCTFPMRGRALFCEEYE